MKKYLDNYDYIFSFGLVIMSALVIVPWQPLQFVNAGVALSFLLTTVICFSPLFLEKMTFLSKKIQILFILVSMLRLSSSFCFSKIFFNSFFGNFKFTQMQFVFGFKGILVFFGLLFFLTLYKLFSKKGPDSTFWSDCVAAKFLIFETFTHIILVFINLIAVVASIITFRYVSMLDLLFYWLKASSMLSLALFAFTSLYCPRPKTA